MNRAASSVSTDQLRAFVELVHSGNMRATAQELHMSCDGLRRKLVALENLLGASLYERPRRRDTMIRLTCEGRLFHAKAIQFLEEARLLTESLYSRQSRPEIKIAVSHYISNYHLSGLVKDFHNQFPNIVVKVLTGTERQVMSTMQSDADVRLGICACDNPPKEFACRRLLRMSWCFVAPLGNPLLQKADVSLEEVADEPLLMYESGCPAREIILEAFGKQGLSPRIVMEVTTTQMMMNLVETGIGTALVPILLPSTMFRGRRIGQARIVDAMPSFEFGVLSRVNAVDDMFTLKLRDHILDQFECDRSANGPLPADRFLNHSNRVDDDHDRRGKLRSVAQLPAQ